MMILIIKLQNFSPKMNKPINIMLTGGNGRLGKSISNYLINKGHRVVIGDLKFKKITKSRKNNLFFLNLT